MTIFGTERHPLAVTDNRNADPKPAIVLGNGRLMCPGCRGILNKHNATACPDCRQRLMETKE